MKKNSEINISIVILNFNSHEFTINCLKSIELSIGKYLEFENSKLKSDLSYYDEYGIEVDVTMYQPVYPQTDKTPDITADGTKIRISKASEYKFVALSRNLLKRWGGPFDYGDFILIKGAGKKDGVYQVRDTMNPKWVNVVDILESKGVNPYKFENCDIFKLEWTEENV